MTDRCWSYVGPIDAHVLSMAKIGGDLWIGTVGHGVLRYDASHNEWRAQAFPGKSVRSILYLPSTGAIWATVNGAGFPDTTLSYLYVSMDGGATWQPRDGGLAAAQQYYSAVGPLAIDPSDPARLVVGIPTGVALSEDGGASWREVLGGVGTVLSYDALAISPALGTRIWAGGANLQLGDQFARRSDDGGRTWNAIGQPGPSGHGTVAAFLASATNPDRALASIWGSVQETNDAGASWAPAFQLAHTGGYVYGFAVAPTMVLAVSAEDVGTIDGALGVYSALGDTGPWTSVATPSEAGGGSAILLEQGGSWAIGTTRGVWLVRN